MVILKYTMKDKWNVHELHNMLVHKEIKLMNQGNHSIYHVNNQVVGKKVHKKHGKGNGPLKINEASSKIYKKNEKCHLCGKYGHFQKDYPKCKTWFEKKRIPFNLDHKPK